MDTVFTPHEHGFAFANEFEGLYPQLCGGMSFGSLDYYYTGLTIPQNGQAPRSGDPLYEYILMRQIHAHTVAIPALMAGRTSWGVNSRLTGVTSAYAAVKGWIQSGSPLPVLLGDLDNPLSTRSHWVVATGCQDGDGGTMSRIYLYDNNHPNRRCWISPSDTAGRPSFIHSIHGQYGFYVPHLEYRPLDPRTHRGPGWAVAGADRIDV